MPEYQNIQSRMLGADSFPYRNVTVDDDVYEKAEDAVNRLFFVGLQEEFEVSAYAVARELQTNESISIVKERDQQSSQSIKKQKQDILKNQKVMDRLREVNQYDIRLYQVG